MSQKPDYQPGVFQWSFLQPRYWGIWIGIALLMILAVLPWAVQHRLAAFLGNTAFKYLKSRRKTAVRNLEVCFPEWPAAQVQDNARRVFVDQMIGIFETLNAWYCPRWFNGRVSIEGLEHLHKAQADGAGVLLLGTHSTLLDAGGYLCSRHFAMGAVYRPQNNPLLDLLIYRCRDAIYSCQIDHDDMRGLIRQLKDGQAIWYSPDQDFGLKQGVMAPFFGVPAATLSALPRLTKLGGAVVMTKTTPKVNVTRGELVPYTLTARNTLGSALTDIAIEDQIPPGFKYVKGSAQIDGIPVEPQVEGRRLRWPGRTR